MRFEADKIVAIVANWRTWRWRTLTLLSRYLNFSQVIKWGIFGKSSSRRIEWCIFCSYTTSGCGKKRVYCILRDLESFFLIGPPLVIPIIAPDYPYAYIVHLETGNVVKKPQIDLTKKFCFFPKWCEKWSVFLKIDLPTAPWANNSSLRSHKCHLSSFMPLVWFFIGVLAVYL